jgi:hypothetical protein
MKQSLVFVTLITLALLLASPALAQKDYFTPDPRSPNLGSQTGGSTFYQTITCSAQKRTCNGNACTEYPRTVGFSISAKSDLAIAAPRSLALRLHQSVIRTEP